MRDGYSVNMRKDRRTGEYLAVIPRAYRNRHGDRYYMAMTLCGWAELSPEYVTRMTHTVSDFPEAIKRKTDRALGYILNITTRLKG